MTARMKGELFNNSEVIRQVHNSFARPEGFIVTQDKKKK